MNWMEHVIPAIHPLGWTFGELNFLSAGVENYGPSKGIVEE